MAGQDYSQAQQTAQTTEREPARNGTEAGAEPGNQAQLEAMGLAGSAEDPHGDCLDSSMAGVVLDAVPLVMALTMAAAHLANPVVLDWLGSVDIRELTEEEAGRLAREVGKGTALPFRDELEDAQGADFGAVEVFAGLGELLDALGVEGFAAGERVAFASSSPEKDLVAHELTHVVQQREGRAAGVQLQEEDGTGGDAAEQEAEEAAVGTNVDVDGGNEEQAAMIREAVPVACAMASAGLKIIQEGPTCLKNQKQLGQRFNTYDDSILSKAADAISSTIEGLKGDFTIEVDGWQWPWEEGSQAGVYVGPGGLSSDIHVFSEFFLWGCNDRARTLVHEGSHKWGGALLHGDVNPDTDPNLAVQNADTIEVFCYQEYTDTW